jgi:type I restriction enzyme S subunit
VQIPNTILLKEYHTICSLYYDKIQDLFIENAQLASLRDWLLPMLMNGQVKFKN